MSTDYPHLFSPFHIAGRRLRNRVVHASMSLHMGVGGRVTDEVVRYHANRARGGAGLIVTEPIRMLRHQRIVHRAQAWDDSDLDGLKRWADAVESQDCRLLGQIWDPGRGRHEPGRNPDAVGASSLPDDLSWTVPHALTPGEIRSIVEQFAAGSHRLKRCGFSGVEISAGHGHLFHQFLSPWSNQRTDAYGGTVEGRTRFVAELIAAIRAACGSDFIIGLKLPGDDGVRGGIDPEGAAPIADCLTAGRAVDYVCFAQGSHSRALEMHVPDGYGPRMPYMPFIRELRRSINGVPLVALGRITDPAEGEGLLAQGDAELVGFGRALVCDPALPLKASRNRVHDIRYCVSCNTCWGTIVSHRPIACDNNPRLGQADEVDWWPARAAAPKRVVVVGAGLSGMEAAWVAAARGHSVTVFGRSTEVGGKARLRAGLPGGEAVSSVYDYQHGAALRAGVRFELGREAGAADVLALRPDVVVLAAGSRMIAPRWLPSEVRAAGLVPDLREAMAALAGITQRQPGTAVVYDMDHTEGTYGAVERLHELFGSVVLVTPRDCIAQDTAMVTHQGISRRLSRLRTRILLLSEPVWSERMEDAELEVEQVYTGERTVITDVAFLAWSTPRAPEQALAGPLREAGVDVRLAGDCLTARNVLAATSEGHAIGNAV